MRYVREMSEWHGADIFNKDGIERQRDGNENLIEKKYREKGIKYEHERRIR